MGLLWLKCELKANNEIIDNFVQRLFVHIWQEEGEVDSSQDIEPLLLATKRTQDKFDKAYQDKKFIDEWHDFIQSKGFKHLEEARLAAQSKSINSAPTFLLGSEPFRGHAQLPLITARLKAGI